MDQQIEQPMRDDDRTADGTGCPVAERRAQQDCKPDAPGKGASQRMRPRHVIKVHRVHCRYARRHAHMFDAEGNEAEEGDVDKLCRDEQCAEFGRFGQGGGDKGRAIMSHEHCESPLARPL